MFVLLLLICLQWACFSISETNFDALKDNVLFQINWPGSSDIDINKLAGPGVEYKDDSSFVVTSSINEQYQCTIPTLSSSDRSADNNEAHSNSISQLLGPILESDICTYIVESYWTYELCHGKHVRQYHEERTKKTASSGSATYVIKSENGKVMLQPEEKTELIKTFEYFLGYFKSQDGSFISKNDMPLSIDQVKKKNINGVKTPYFAINVTDGTPCDLKSGSGRRSSVLYICGQVSRPTLLSITETSSCEYELVVLTSELCKHPFYKIRGQEVNQIQCLPLRDAPAKPAALTKFLERQPTDSRHSQQRVYSRPGREDTSSPSQTIETSISPLVDKSLLRDFLSGSYCLHGGSGWWRFEYCYGRYVQQYHDDKKTGRVVINVGYWDKDAHIEWASKSSTTPIITKKGEEGHTTVTQVAHFYGNGDMCEETGKPREVVVRMKCKKNSVSAHSVAIYLLEPHTCSYILGVESPIFCDLLDSADEHGMLTLS